MPSNAGGWTARFIRHDERLLARICVLLPKCMASLSANPLEEDITKNLVLLLRKDRVVRRLFHYCDYQYVPLVKINGVFARTGIIDLAFIMDKDHKRYLAYEAKRLNVTMPSGFHSLAKDYVTEGVERFASGRYSRGLPVAGMLGYVLDGNIDTIHPELIKALADNCPPDKMVDLDDIGPARRFATDHVRSDGSGPINLRHALVPCV